MKNKNTVTNVTVNLDETVPEYMEGIIRCGQVTSEDENGDKVADHDELIDNTEYHSEDQLIADVADRLSVSPSIITIQ